MAKIFNITPEEQRKLGLRRNTLWYMKKNIKEGKRIKIYRKIGEKVR